MNLFELATQFEREAETLEGKAAREGEAKRAREDAARVRAWAFNNVMLALAPGHENRDFVRFLLADALVTAVGDDHAEKIAERFARIANPLKQAGVDQLTAASEIRKAIAFRNQSETVSA